MGICSCVRQTPLFDELGVRLISLVSWPERPIDYGLLHERLSPSRTSGSRPYQCSETAPDATFVYCGRTQGGRVETYSRIVSTPTRISRDLFRHSLPLPSSNVLRGLRLLCTAAIQRMHAPTGDSKAFSPPSGCRTNPLVSRQVSRSYDQHREARQKKATNTTMYAGAREPPGATFSCSSGLGFAMRRGQVSAPARADAMATHLPQQQAAGLFD